MEDIVSQIAEKTGLDREAAQKAFHAAVDVIKSRLPKSVGDQLPGLLLEKKEFDFAAILKEKMDDLKSDTGEKLSGLKGDAGEKLEDLKDGAKDLFNKMFK